MSTVQRPGLCVDMNLLTSSHNLSLTERARTVFNYGIGLDSVIVSDFLTFSSPFSTTVKPFRRKLDYSQSGTGI